MKVIEIKEDFPKKGMCVMEIEATKDEIDFYVEYAINDMIKKGMEAHEEALKPKKEE